MFIESLEDYYLYCEGDVPLLFTENETNNARLFGSANASPYVKDGINDYAVYGKSDAVNPGRVGTKAAAHYQLTVPAAQSRAIRLRLTRRGPYRILLDRFRLYDLAIKVVGVGSAGTFCAVTLFMAGDNDPLFLQVKQANASVLEPYAGKSRYSNHGERVVMGQRLRQAASDMMLG
jgi:hypothetical protein